MPVNVHGQPVGEPVIDWQPRPQPGRTAMQGAVCRLEPLDVARHGASLFDAYAQAPDGRDWTYLPIERPTDRDAFTKEFATRERMRDPLHYAIVVGGRAVGTAALMRIDPGNGVMEIGHIAFAPVLQKTRAGTEAIALLMRRSFDELGYRRLEWKCDSLNEPSRRAAERLGFTFEGIFRKAVVTKGRARDTAWYSITSDEWPMIIRALDRWLRPDNFDAAGRQRVPLARLRSEQP